MQRRRRLRRVAIPNSQALSLLGRDLREAHLQVLLGGGYRSNNTIVSTSATDPILSSLILNFPASEAEEISKSVVANADDTSTKKAAPAHIWKSRYYSRFLICIRRILFLKRTFFFLRDAYFFTQEAPTKTSIVLKKRTFTELYE